MDSASIKFIVFGLVVALFSNFNRSRSWRSIVLLVASLAFIGSLVHNPIELLPLAGFLLLGYACLVLLNRKWLHSAAWGVLAVIFLYIWLKKYSFLPEAMFLHSAYFTLGLSYIFFRVLHLLIEAGDGGLECNLGFGSYLLYTLNFTTFVSGPIQRYNEFARDQFANEPIPLSMSIVGLQLERIVRGFFKVNVLAALLQPAQQDALEQLTHPFTALPVKLFAASRLVVVYPLFLYANFSGYIDIVIALARLMRVRLPENFDRPFSASSVLDFWNQWHMTLSNWLKTYVYNPLLLALMRRISSVSMQPFLGVFCFFVTFFLIGVWHGRTSEFIFFGVLTGSGMSVNKLWQLALTRGLGRKGYKKLAANGLYIALGRGLNFVWFAFTLFWFWGSWEQVNEVFSALDIANWFGIWMAAWLFAAAALALWEWLRSALLSITVADGPMLTSRYARVVYASSLGLIALAITVLLNQPAPAIVYKAF